MPFQVWIRHDESDTNEPLRTDCEGKPVPLFATAEAAEAFILTQDEVDHGLGSYPVKEVA